MTSYLARLKALKAQNQPPEELTKATKAPFVSFGSTTEASIDAAGPTERTAIVEVDGNVPATYSAEFARLQQACPAGVTMERWLQFIDDAGRFFDAWGHLAAALGWRAEDLFGLDPIAPLARYDRLGLLWLLQGEAVTAITSTSAGLSGGLVYRRYLSGGTGEAQHG